MGTKRIFLLVFAATLFGLISPIIADAGKIIPAQLSHHPKLSAALGPPTSPPVSSSRRSHSKLGQIVVIENQSGAGGRTGAKARNPCQP